MEKRNNISQERKEFAKKIVKEFDLKTAGDAQNLLKGLFGPILQGMFEAELDDQLGYNKYERTETVKPNSRNGHSLKTVATSYGDIEIAIPRNRNGEYEPQVVKKYQRDISDIEGKIISMYANGMTTRDISGHLKEIYGILSASRAAYLLLCLSCGAWKNHIHDKRYRRIQQTAEKGDKVEDRVPDR